MENSINIKKLVITTVVAFIAMFGFGGIWHFILFNSYYNQNPDLAAVSRNPAYVGIVTFGELLHAFAAAWFFLMIYRHGANIIRGIVFGIILGIIGISLLGFISYGAMNLPGSWIPMDGSFLMLQGMIAGILLAMINRKK